MKSSRGFVGVLHSLTATAGVIGFSLHAFSATILWSNFLPDFNFGLDWNGGNIPTATDVASFATITTAQPYFTADTNVGGIALQAGGTQLTLTGTGGGQILTLGSFGLANDSTNSMTLDSNALGILLGSGTTFTANGRIFIGSSTSSLSLGGNGLTLSGTSTDSEIAKAISGGGSGSVTKDGVGTWTLSSTNFYSGGTTVNSGALRLTGSGSTVGPVTINSGGTLQIGATDTLVGTTAVTLGGGKLQIINGAFSQSFSSTPLALTASSIIDFGLGLGNSAITFGDSSGQSWTGTLTISNFAAGDSLRFGSSSSALSGSQLLAIKFDGVDAQIDASGFVTPVPEPSTYAACAGLLTFTACAFRRRRRAQARSDS